MSEVMLKTHLIVSGMHEEYSIKWNGQLANANPMFKHDEPVFVIVGSEARVEIETFDLKRVEECAKRLAVPHGKQAVTTATSYIYIKEVGGSERFLGRVVHNHIKEYKQMYDKFERM